MRSTTPEESANRQRQAVEQLGPPLFVPSGELARYWRFSGVGSDRDGVSSVSASVHWIGSQLTVRTFKYNAGSREGLHRAGLAAMVLGGSLKQSEDIQLPFTATVDETSIQIRIDEQEDVSFQCIYAPRNWIALGSVDDRWVWIHGIEMESEAISLDRISDLQTIDESRYGI